MNLRGRVGPILVLSSFLALTHLAACDGSSSSGGGGSGVRVSPAGAPAAAATAFLELFGRHAARRGESWFTEHDGTLYEMREVKLSLSEPVTLGDADRLNGIEEARFGVLEGAVREYRTPTNGWSSWGPRWPNSRTSVDYLLVRKSGGWSAEPNANVFVGRPCPDPDAWVANATAAAQAPAAKPPATGPSR